MSQIAKFFRALPRTQIGELTAPPNPQLEICSACVLRMRTLRGASLELMRQPRQVCPQNAHDSRAFAQSYENAHDSRAFLGRSQIKKLATLNRFV